MGNMKPYFLFLFPLALFPLTAQADWVMLTNGDRISGTIVSQDTRQTILDSAVAGRVTIPAGQISSTHKGQAPRVLAREMRTGQPMTAPSPAPVAMAPTQPPQTDTSAPVAEPVQAGQKPGVYKWSGRVNAGGQLQNGNDESKSITADAEIKARDQKNRFSFGGEVNWAEEDGDETDNDQQIYGEYDRFITEKWFVGGRQSLERDEFEELDLRSRTGLFAGHQFYERDDLNLQVKAGPEYIYEKFDNGDTENDVALAWGLEYDQKVFDDALQVFHNHNLSTPFSDTDAFLFDSATGARVPIGDNFTASAQVDFDWDNDPAPGVKEDDTTYGLKLGYEWD